MIRIGCPSCGCAFNVRPEVIGRKVSCSKCKTQWRATDPKAPAPPAVLPPQQAKPVVEPPTVEPFAFQEEEPRKPRRNDDYDKPRRRREREEDYERPRRSLEREPHIEINTAPPRGNSFLAGFGITSGVLLAICVFAIALPTLACCGGAALLLAPAAKRVHDVAAEVQAKNAAKALPAEPAIPQPPQENSPQEAWGEIGQYVTIGDDVAVKVTEVLIEQIDLDNNDFKFALRKTDKIYSHIGIKIENRSATKRLNYLGWSRDQLFNQKRPKLTDEHGNTYSTVGFNFGPKVKGQLPHGDAIHPEKVAYDVLVFERPVDAAKELRLELPTDDLGVPGKWLRFKLVINK